MKLYLKFLSIHFRSAMTYRASFFLSCLGQLLITTNVFLSVVFLLDRFESVGGYTLPQLSLCYSVILAATSLSECFARGIDAFGRVLSQAQFDRIMLRPRPLLFQVLCQDMKPDRLARVVQAAVMLVWAIGSGAVHWTTAKALVLALMILCGAAIFFGVALINACITFFTLEHVEALNIFMDGPREYGKCPWPWSSTGRCNTSSTGDRRGTGCCPSCRWCSLSPAPCCGGWGCGTTGPRGREKF